MPPVVYKSLGFHAIPDDIINVRHIYTILAGPTNIATPDDDPLFTFYKDGDQAVHYQGQIWMPLSCTFGDRRAICNYLWMNHLIPEQYRERFKGTFTNPIKLFIVYRADIGPVYLPRN